MLRLDCLSLAALLPFLGAQGAETRRDDPAPLRLALLAEMDARIDADAARAHLEARLMLDQVLPIAFLGIVPVPGPDGLLVTQVYRESGAAAVGVAAGDVILAFDGLERPTKEALYVAIRRRVPGDVVDVRVRRDGKELVLRPTLGKRWEEDEEDVEQFADMPPAPFAARGLPVTMDFEAAEPGQRPAALAELISGVGMAPGFQAFRYKDERVLRQTAADPMGLRFPMALVEGVDADDVAGRVRFRLVGGAQDRCAGIILRYEDPSNYLVARANAVEGDLRIFRTVNGLRRTLPGCAAEVHIDDEDWHVLEFRAEGPKVTATLDGAVTVSSYDTYFLHGRVGVWTKSDAVTDFDDLSFTAPAR